MAGKSAGKIAGMGALGKGSKAISGELEKRLAGWTAHALLSSQGVSREAALVKVGGRLAPDFAKIPEGASAEVVLLRKPSLGEEAAKEGKKAGSTPLHFGNAAAGSAPQYPGRCSKCGKPAAITLAYARSEYCQSHFVKFFESRVKRCVRQFAMLKKGEKVAVGLSGGKDSCVVLHMLHKIRQSLPFGLMAITIDAGIPGEYANTIEVAREECRKLGVEHHVVSMKEEFGKSLPDLASGSGKACSYCGVARRYLLNKYARKLGASRLAIGHNADDVAQTVLMNFMRNEPGRLARFAPLTKSGEGEFVPRIKPLFTTPERDVAAYALMKGMPIGFEECPYARGAFRQDVREMLNAMEEKYPSTKLRIVRAFLAQLGESERQGRVARGSGFGEKREKEPVGGRRNQKEARGHSGNNAQNEKGLQKIPSCPSCGEPSSKEGKKCAMCAMLGD
jgi:uncharacterized protein (TIGR00269 family)